MSYEITFEHHDGYFVAIVTGENSAATVLGFLDDLIEECRKQKCYHFVLDKRTEGPRLGINDIFELVAHGTSKALGIFRAVAVVDPQTGEMLKYAEKLSRNRGVYVKMFDTVPEAEEWIKSLDADGEDEAT